MSISYERRLSLAVGQANIEWYLNPVTRELKDQVEFCSQDDYHVRFLLEPYLDASSPMRVCQRAEIARSEDDLHSAARPQG